MAKMLVTLAIVVSAAILAGGQSLTTSSGNATWQGRLQCQVTVQGPGYSNLQTHTWTITGPPTIAGVLAEYPATWTVSGRGTNQTAGAQWTTNGSMPSAKIGIFVRPSDGRLVALLRSAQLSVPGATTGMQAVVGLQPRAIVQTVSEWRPLPVMEDVGTSTHLTGSSSIPITSRLDALQPAAAAGQALCSWDFAQSPAVASPLPPAGQVISNAAPPAISAPLAGSDARVQPAVPAVSVSGGAPNKPVLSARGGGAAANTGSAPSNTVGSQPSAGMPAVTVVDATVRPIDVTVTQIYLGATLSGPAKLTAGTSSTFQLTLIPPMSQMTVSTEYSPAAATSTTATTQTTTSIQTTTQTTVEFVVLFGEVTFTHQVYDAAGSSVFTEMATARSSTQMSATFLAFPQRQIVSVDGAATIERHQMMSRTVTTTYTTHNTSCNCDTKTTSVDVQQTPPQVTSFVYRFSGALPVDQ